MVEYHIDGGYPIRGTVRAGGNKNAALPCIAAALLTEEPVTLRSLPDIEDIQVMLDVAEALGARIERDKPSSSVTITASSISRTDVPNESAGMARASVLFAGALLGRVGEIHLPAPGGDVIGRRPLDTHFLALGALGATVEYDGVFHLTTNRLVGSNVFLDEASVTATENAILAATRADGKTVIENAASEPHVQDLCNMLVAMGARITGIGSNILSIQGTKRLHGCDFTIGYDFMEVGSLIGLAAVTRGELVIEGVDPQHLRMSKIAFGRLGIHWESDGSTIRVPAGLPLRVRPSFGGMIPKIEDAPWPGFPTDLTSIATVVATQVEGTILIHEKMYESRMFFVDKLIGMGARIILCDPHRAVVSGPSRLRGGELVSPDIRAGMAMLIAALCADGRSRIQNVYQIERGYEDLAGRLGSLGARIERVTTHWEQRSP